MAATLLASSTQRIDLGAGSVNTWQNQTTGTLMGWVNLTSYSGGAANQLFGFSNGLVQTDSRLTARVDSGGNVIALARRLDADAVISITGGTIAFGSAWNHIALVATWNGAFFGLYVNGVLTASTNPGGWNGATSNTASLAAAINGQLDGSGLFSNMNVQDVRCYRRALSAAEIAHIAQARGGDRVRNALYHRWQLDGGAPGVVFSGSVVRDYGSANRTVVAINNPVWAGAPLRTRPRMSA
jgi:hypothetical protein